MRGTLWIVCLFSFMCVGVHMWAYTRDGQRTTSEVVPLVETQSLIGLKPCKSAWISGRNQPVSASHPAITGMASASHSTWRLAWVLGSKLRPSCVITDKQSLLHTPSLAKFDWLVGKGAGDWKEKKSQWALIKTIIASVWLAGASLEQAAESHSQLLWRYPLFSVEETEAQRGGWTCPATKRLNQRSHAYRHQSPKLCLTSRHLRKTRSEFLHLVMAV